MGDVVQIDIKYLPGSPEIRQIEGSDWIDLYTYEDVSLAEGCFTLVSLGISMNIPEDYIRGEIRISMNENQNKVEDLIETARALHECYEMVRS